MISTLLSYVKQEPGCLVPNTHPILDRLPERMPLKLYLEDQSALQEIATDDNQTGDTEKNLIC